MTEPDRETIRAEATHLAELAGTPAFAEELQHLLTSLGSEENAAGQRRFIPGLAERRVYGVGLPLLRDLAAALGQALKRQPEQALALAAQLWRNGSREERIIAAKLLEPLGKTRGAEVLSLAASFVGDIGNWEECDQLAMFALRQVVQRQPEFVLPRCAEWVRAPNLWARRFGLVVLTSAPKGGGYTPGEAEFAILDAVMADPAREVQDAAAWLLREITRRNPAAVAAYLRRYAPGAPRPTRRIIKEALKALPAEEQEAIRQILEGGAPDGA